MSRWPEALTDTSPAAPLPKVEVDITPLLRIETFSAETVTRPALPPLGSSVLAKNFRCRLRNLQFPL